MCSFSFNVCLHWSTPICYSSSGSADVRSGKPVSYLQASLFSCTAFRQVIFHRRHLLDRGNNLLKAFCRHWQNCFQGWMIAKCLISKWVITSLTWEGVSAIGMTIAPVTERCWDGETDVHQRKWKMICSTLLVNIEFLNVKVCVRGSLWGGPAVTFSASWHALLWGTVQREDAIHLAMSYPLFGFVLLIETILCLIHLKLAVVLLGIGMHSGKSLAKYSVWMMIRKVIFGWQAALLCPSLAFWWEKTGNVWSKLCFIFIRVEEEGWCHVQAVSYNRNKMDRGKLVSLC